MAEAGRSEPARAVDPGVGLRTPAGNRRRNRPPFSACRQPAAIRRVKDPQNAGGRLRRARHPAPGISVGAASRSRKLGDQDAGGAGGAHIARAKGEAPHGRYFQRFVPGDSISALFIGDGRSARIVGFSRQWVSPAPGAPYRYGGAVRLRRFARSDAATIGDWLSGLTLAPGWSGYAAPTSSANADGYHLIEINPRPGATLDIFDSAEAPLMEAHLRAVEGELYDLPRFAERDGVDDHLCVGAGRAISRESPGPTWTADRQSPGTRLIAGDPVCTVFARGPSAGATRRRC